MHTCTLAHAGTSSTLVLPAMHRVSTWYSSMLCGELHVAHNMQALTSNTVYWFGARTVLSAAFALWQ